MEGLLANNNQHELNPRVATQQTIRNPVTLSGTGLHNGQRVNMTLLPGPPNSGIRFCRTDLEGKPEIEAKIDQVVETARSTTLGKGNVKIHTVEHILANFAGFQIDNALVELDANEPPVGDGSARQFSELIRQAGIEPQADTREVFEVKTPLELEMGETLMSIFPHPEFKISCTSTDRAGRFTQFASFTLNPEVWEQEIAHARTFCFYEEIEQLIKNGLIKGGSLENAVVIREDAVLTTEPLRYDNEFVRHKILDIIGDLALAGRSIKGHLIAIRPSHSANCELARQLQAQMRKPMVAAQTFSPPPPMTRSIPSRSSGDQQGSVQEAPVEDAVIRDGDTLDIIQVMKILPHRYPFLMVDAVTKIDGNKITGLKNITVNEPYFQGHFPSHPIMPGVLQLEAIAQVAGILMLRQIENMGKLAYFMSAENVKWRKPVRPGDTLIIDVELTKSRGKIGKAKGICYVGEEAVSEADVTFMLQSA